MEKRTKIIDVSKKEANDNIINRLSPIKREYTAQEISEKEQLLASEDQTEQATGIYFFIRHLIYTNTDSIKRIFEIGSEDEEMALLVLQEFLLPNIQNRDLSIVALTEACILDFISQFISVDDPFLFQLAAKVLVQLCKRDFEFMDTISESSTIEDMLKISEQAISEIITMEDCEDQEFIDNVYLIEGTFELVELFLPNYSEESGTLICNLLEGQNENILSLAFDCLYKWTQKGSIELFESMFNERFQKVFHDFMVSHNKHLINTALFIADKSMKRCPELCEIFIQIGFGELTSYILTVGSDEVALFASILCSIADVDSEITNSFIASEGLNEILMNIIENYSYGIYQYVFIFLINFCKRNNEETLMFVVQNYYPALNKMIDALNSGKLFLAQNILKTFYSILSWAYSKGSSAETLLANINVSELVEAIDGMMENDVSPEIEELANEIRDTIPC